MRAAVSSMASGSRSTLAQIWSRPASTRRRARSRHRRRSLGWRTAALHRRAPAGPALAHDSPATPSGSRLVARTVTPGHDRRIAEATAAASARTCSQLSSTISNSVVARPGRQPVDRVLASGVTEPRAERPLERRVDGTLRRSPVRARPAMCRRATARRGARRSRWRCASCRPRRGRRSKRVGGSPATRRCWSTSPERPTNVLSSGWMFDSRGARLGRRVSGRPELRSWASTCRSSRAAPGRARGRARRRAGRGHAGTRGGCRIAGRTGTAPASAVPTALAKRVLVDEAFELGGDGFVLARRPDRRRCGPPSRSGASPRVGFGAPGRTPRTRSLPTPVLATGPGLAQACRGLGMSAGGEMLVADPRRER